MEKNGYEAMNSEKTIFVKRKGSEYIIHGLFVDDMMHIYTSDAMKALDKQAWAAAYNSEYLGFKQRELFKLIKQAAGVRIHGTLTRLEYKRR